MEKENHSQKIVTSSFGAAESDETTEKPTRRALTLAELRLLADATTNEFPELRWRAAGEVLAAWRRLTETHRLVVEERPVKKIKKGQTA